MPTPNNPFGAPGVMSTGDDIEAALDIIESNGGLGEWEEAALEDIPRWLFPRFPGATDDADMYLSRSGLGNHDSDVETLAAWLAAPRNIVGASLLLGEPGTGKTALIEAAVTYMLPDSDEGEPDPETDLVTVICTPDHTRDSLMLKFVGENHGDCVSPTHTHDGTHLDFDATCDRSPFTLGPVAFAAKYGKKLYMDEFMLLVDGVKPVVYPLADGRRVLPEGNVDGSGLIIHPDFRLVLSSNPMVRGASLPEPVGSRCASTTLTVETSAAMLRDLAIDDAVVSAWEALGTQGLWRPQVREMRLADYWLAVDPAQAVSAFLPEHCPESQRKQVRDVVVSYLGGTIRADGRLVVS